MASLASLSKTQWIILLALLSVNVICIYGFFIPLAAYIALEPPVPSYAEDSSDVLTAALRSEPELREESKAAPESHTVPVSALPTRTSSVDVSAVSPTTPRRTPTAAASPVPSATPIILRLSSARLSPTRAIPAQLVRSDLRSLVSLELNPRVALADRTTFFTSACFGAGASPLQDKDNMTPADWSSSPDRKCIFGYRVDPGSGMPAGRYAVFGGPDGQPRFYIIPPDAFASDLVRVKQLSSMHLILDPVQGCAALGSIGMTADGATYQCSACDFLKAGGMCLSHNGTKSLTLPTNRAFILDPDTTGGAAGFQSYPVLFFKRGFSVYFTGKDGYAPPRIYFESSVDTLRQDVAARTTSEMADRELKAIASEYDTLLSRASPLTSIAAVEQPAQLLSAAPVTLRPKETATISFRAPPASVLSSLVWTIKPKNNIDNKAFLETNLCMDLNGERVCFTGVEDFAHCAFFAPCVTGFSSLVPMGGGGYVATRYFSPGAAPAVHSGDIQIRFDAPDVGTVLEMNVALRVRTADRLLGKK